jgi:chromosomal replication initiator protein
MEIKNIILTVSELTGISTEAIIGKSRKANIVEARQLSMWACRWFTESSLQKIAGEHGKDNHATVIWACTQVDSRASVDKSFKLITQELRNLIKQK